MDIIKMKTDQIGRAISKGELTVGVVGLGWMGLPTACLFAEAGAKVVGADTDTSVGESVNKGVSHLPEPGLQQLVRRHVRSGRLKVVGSVTEAAGQSDVHLVVVPTTVDRTRRADYRLLENASREIAKGMSERSLVIVESTCAPGVTETTVKTTLEKHSGLKAGSGFGLAHSPIRAMTGRVLKDIETYPKVVGGYDETSLEAAAAVLSSVSKGGILKVRDMKTAEASKIFEAVYRDVNIGLANEFALYCEKAGVDYWEAMRAANSQPYSHLHNPGPGVGGHCLPLYPYLLLSEARNLDVSLKLVKNSRIVNEQMPWHVVRLASEGLRQCGKVVSRARVSVLGISYRANAKETRSSPAVELVNLLRRRRARVRVFDPKFSAKELAALGYETSPSWKSAVERADCVIVTVLHDEFIRLDPRGFALAMRLPGLLVDCCGVFDPSSVEKAGLIYRGIGRGVWTK